MKRKLIYCFVFWVLLSSLQLLANRKRDSLLNLLQTEIPDSVRIKALSKLTSYYQMIGKVDSIWILTKQLKKVSLRSMNYKGVADALTYEGNSLFSQGNINAAIDKYKLCRRIAGYINYTKAETSSLNNIANCFLQFGNLPQALKYYLEALNQNEKSKNYAWMCINLGNIGEVYRVMEDYINSNFYQKKALDLFRLMGDTEGESRSLAAIGMNYRLTLLHKKGELSSKLNEKEKALLDSALLYVTQAVELDRNTKYKYGLALHTQNLGLILLDKGEFSRAELLFNESIEHASEMRDDYGVAGTTTNLGLLYIRSGQLQQAEEKLIKAYNTFNAMSQLESIKTCAKNLSDLFLVKKDFKRSLYWYRISIQAGDSLYSNDNARKLAQTQMQFEFDKREMAAFIEQKIKDDLNKKETEKEKVILNLFIVGVLLLSVASIIVFKGYNQKRKANAIISKQKEQVEFQKSVVEAQKHLVEEKQKEIIDSIKYAKRIQTALITNEKYILKNILELKRKN